MFSAIIFAGLLFFAGNLAARAQTTAFTYQGRFSDTSTNPPSSYPMTFRLYDTDGTDTQNPGTLIAQQSPTLATVANGVFTTRIDFGAAAFDTTAPRFLEIKVGSTTLTPRQQILTAPFANRAVNAKAADALSAACLACVTSEQINSIDAGKITGTVNSAATATVAENVSGVVGIANGGTGSTTKNFVDLTTSQIIAGNKTFTGVLSGDGSDLRNIRGANVAGSIAVNPQRLAMRRWYDVNQATLARPIAVGSGPFALEYDGTFVYVANYRDNSVMRF